MDQGRYGNVARKIKIRIRIHLKIYPKKLKRRNKITKTKQQRKKEIRLFYVVILKLMLGKINEC
jgi:hypothetical protein